MAMLKEKYAGKKLIVARDKLDYVKGVRQKLLAFEQFLIRHPEWRGKVRTPGKIKTSKRSPN
jgi:trehalose 6-phosphate synthase/phosphatase